MIIGNREFDTENNCYIMGILNVTPDSFSDGGKWDTTDRALHRAGEMIVEGADIIDVGGESTKPGYVSVTVQEELGRVIPMIEALRSRFDVPVSVDTYRSAVAEAALAAGAALVNDIWGLKRDPEMAGVISRYSAACCLMHNRGDMLYEEFMPDLLSGLSESADIALRAGVGAGKIILDPGVGFAKTYEMNLMVINKLDMIRGLGYPVMLGASRKSVIGTALDLPVTERVEGSLAAAVIGVVRGCSFFRVHDVRETKRAITMAEAVLAAQDAAE